MDNLTATSTRVMGTINQQALGNSGGVKDTNIADAVRTVSSVTGLNIAQNKTFSTIYSIARKFGLTSKFNLINCGTPESILSQAPSQYVINILGTSVAKDASGNSKTLYNINALLQERIKIRTSATWESLTPNSFSATINSISQGVTGLSVASSLATRRIWTGTKPLELEITFKFEAQEDPKMEVVYPSLVLKQMSLPGRSFTGGAELFLIPPGPSPFSEVQDVLRNIGVTKGISGGGEETTLSIGSFLRFKRVIIDSVDSVYDARFGVDNNPMGATVKVVFSTYEIMTKESLEESFLTISGGQTVKPYYNR